MFDAIFLLGVFIAALLLFYVLDRFFGRQWAFVTVLFMVPSTALSATIDIGTALASWQDYVSAIMTVLVTALVGWVLYLGKSKLNISIDDSMRDALQTWLQRQASSLVAAGAVKVQGLKIEVQSQTLATAANLGLKEIPDALNHFGLTPDKLAAMIEDKIPHVPAVASVAAATAAPSAASTTGAKTS